MGNIYEGQAGQLLSLDTVPAVAMYWPCHGLLELCPAGGNIIFGCLPSATRLRYDAEVVQTVSLFKDKFVQLLLG